MHGLKKVRKKEKPTPASGVVRLRGCCSYSALADVVLAAVDQVVQIGQQNAALIIHLHIPLLSFGVA